VRDLVRRASPFVPDEDGWATRTLVDAMARAFLLMTAVWQLVMLGAVVASPGPVTRLLPLLAAHAAALVLTLVARAGRLPLWLPVVAVPVLYVADWAAADSMNDPLLFAGCWMMNLGSATPAFVLRGRTSLVLAVAGALLVPPAMLVARPDLGPAFPIAVLGTQVALVAATRIGLSYLFDFATRADEEAATALRERTAVATQEAASRASAEDARVLHDTVINTLAALASGGAAVSDTDAVRERCARDIATVTALRDGAEPVAGDDGLRAASYDTRVRVRHLGLADDHVERLEAALPAARLRALRRATAELVQNAAKHAGVDEVEVRAEERDGDLMVTVADDGAGFDGRVGTGGLASSVVSRVQEAGIGLHLDTAPGAGTRVTLSAPATALGTDRPGPGRDITRVVQVMRRRGCLLYAAGVAVMGFFLSVNNHPGEATPDYLMATLAALGAALAWQTTRHRDSLPWWAVTVLAGAAGTAFVLSAAAVDYGRDDPVLWQAIGATGLLIVIAELGPRPRTVLWAGAVYATVVVTVAVLSGRQTSDQAETIVLMAGAAGLGLVAAWRRFQNTIGEIGSRAAADQQATWSARTRLAEREAADRSRARWRDAGLDRSLELLESARGADDPGNAALRLRCATEEAYLRQLTLLHPDLVHVGQWFARALNEAHDSGVRLVVRSGGTDLPADVAADLGTVVLAAVAGTPSGADLTVTLFPDPAGARMTLVGAHPHLGAGVRSAAGPLAARAKVLSVGGQDVAEILLDVPA
jgi:signal transduction histidine kinase